MRPRKTSSGSRTARLFAVMGLVALAIAAALWATAVTPPSPGRILGIYPPWTFFYLAVLTYGLLWLGYLGTSRKPLRQKLLQFATASASLVLILVLVEVPAALGAVDYRHLGGMPPDLAFTRLKPWDNPSHQLDPELIHIRPAGQRIVGETPGDLVDLYQIPTTRRYRLDAEFDHHGFRNSRAVEQAPIVILGDSFVESGLVGQEDTLNEQLRRLLGLEVVNLGQSGYGPQQELIVLQRYALGLQPRVVLWLFFEGNDLLDLRRYDRVIADWNRLTRFRERSFTKNALKRLQFLTQPPVARRPSEAHRRSCELPSADEGEAQTMYFAYKGADLGAEDLASLGHAQRILTQARDLTREAGAEMVLVFVPTKYRVYRDLCRFPPDGYGRDWVINDLPSRLGAWASTNDLPYLDLTPFLQAAAQDSRLVFFPDDGHWNEHGVEEAARSIAALVSGLLTDPAPPASDTGNERSAELR